MWETMECPHLLTMLSGRGGEPSLIASAVLHGFKRLIMTAHDVLCIYDHTDLIS